MWLSLPSGWRDVFWVIKSLQMAFFGAEVGREWGAGREELVFHRGVLQWCHGLVWPEFCMFCWTLGWMLHPSALRLSQLVFPSPSYHTGAFDGAPSLFPQHSTFPLLQNPLEQMGEMLM